MQLNRILIFSVLFFFFASASAQRIIYSEPDNSDTRRMNFEIIGKVSGNFLVYKNIRDKSFISVYNTDMVQENRVEHDYMPDDRLINVDFFSYPDFAYMIYQYQKKNVVYCNAVKIDGSGKKISEIIPIDTSHIGLASNNRIYSSITSENKDHLMVFKINSRNKSKYIFTTILLDDKLAMKKRSQFVVPMEEYNDRLDEFSLDNDGDFLFARLNRASNETVTATNLMIKMAMSDTLEVVPVPHHEIFLDEPHIKVDNHNKRYFFTSFFYKQKRGNIEGFYFYVFDKQTRLPLMQNALSLGEDIRKEARNEAGLKTALNDFFIRSIIIKKDGGFLINSESYYTSSRFGAWNRWNYLYGMPSYGDYYSSYSPLYSNWWWRNRSLNAQAVRHHADNVMILSFDASGNLGWSSIIHKGQYDDESPDRISYLMGNTGGQLHYIFNTDEKNTFILNDLALSPGGEISNNHNLKNLDRGYEFLPRYGKQVSSNQMIIPCYYRNYICFAKIEFN